MDRHVINFNLFRGGEIIVKGRIFDPTELIVENDKNNFVFIEVALQGAKFLGVPFFSQKIPRTRGDFSFARFKFNEILPSNVNMGITGIENLMNSCYMNSGIQCLSNCTELTKYFLLGFHNLDINKTNATGQNGELANAYAETIDALWKGHKQGIEPRELKSQVSRKAEQFGGYGQEDSGELIVFLLDGLHEDLNHAKRSDSVAAKEDDGEAQWDQYWNHNDSIIMELFLGQMKTQITCPQCNYKANKFETFITLSLPIPSFSYISIINVSEDFKLPATKKTIKVEHKMTMKSLNMNSEKKYLYTIIKGGRIAYRIHESISLLKVTDYTEEVYVFEYKPGEVGQECHLVEIQIEKSGVLCKRPMILRANLTWTLQKFKLEVFKKLLPFFKEQPQADEVEAYRNYFGNNDSAYQLCLVPGADGCEFCDSPHTCNCSFNFTEEDRLTLGTVIRELKGKRNLVLSIMLNPNDNKIDIKSFIDCIESIKTEDSKIVREKRNLTIYDCLDEFNKEEQLDKDNMWSCNKCNEKVQAIKSLSISKVPPILIVQLNRFVHDDIYSDTRKIESFVEYPLEGFNLEKYVAGSEKEKAHYNLFAVTNHFGVAGDGQIGRAHV